jgi:hypothetical protein
VTGIYAKSNILYDNTLQYNAGMAKTIKHCNLCVYVLYTQQA